MNDDSYIKMPAGQVRELANTRRAEIRDQRNDVWAHWIEFYQNKRAFWRRFFPWLAPLTIEQAEQRITQTTNFICWADNKRCHELAAMASAIPESDTVFLSCSDYMTLTTGYR